MRKTWGLAIAIFLIAASVVLGQNCGIVSRPAVEDMSLASVTGYKHTGLEKSCAGCHNSERPAPSLKLPLNAKAALNQSLSQYVHQSNFGGMGDCYSCHATEKAGIGLTWSGAQYNHLDNNKQTVTSCTSCHEAPKATLTSNPRIGFDHAGNNQDCISCHTNVGVTWTTAYKHTGNETSCSSCHLDRPAPNLRLPTNATAALNQSLTQYLHQAPFNGLGDCVSCHTENKANVGVTWAGGFYDHTTPTGAKVATCMTCHLAPKGNPSTTPSVGFDHAASTTDCISCHKSPGVSWAGATGGHAHMPTDSCINCHLSERPAATTLKPSKVAGVPWKNLFVHSADYVNGIDCKSCHTKNLANLGVSWSDAGFGHRTVTGGLVQSCAPCHTSGEDRPAATVRLPASATTVTNVYYHDAPFGGLGDCMKCHLASSPNLGKTWAGGVFNHQNASGQPITSGCITCHSAQMPGPTVAMPTNLVNSFVHSTNYVGNGDCFGCHATKNTNTKASSAWAGARWKNRTTHHKTASGAAITTCLPCHSNRDHNRGRECYQCHRNAGQNWNEL